MRNYLRDLARKRADRKAALLNNEAEFDQMINELKNSPNLGLAQRTIPDECFGSNFGAVPNTMPVTFNTDNGTMTSKYLSSKHLDDCWNGDTLVIKTGRSKPLRVKPCRCGSGLNFNHCCNHKPKVDMEDEYVNTNA